MEGRAASLLHDIVRMPIGFMVDDFKSIKDTQKLSFVSGSTNKMGNTGKVGKLELLPSAVIYGGNASGRSNVLESFAMMGRIVFNKDKIIQFQDLLPYDPHGLCTETEDSPAVSDIAFTVVGEVRYWYGVEYDS